MVGIELLRKEDPHYLPGYGGYCPQHQFSSGNNFGDLSHEQLIDPKTLHSKKLVLTDNAKTPEVDPKKDDVSVVDSRAKRLDPVYKHPMVPSYAGFVPSLGLVRDKPFEVQATKGIAKFERNYLKKKESHDQLKRTIELQNGAIPENIEERLALKTQFKLPLIAVRPERIGFQRNLTTEERYERPKDYNTSPYFMQNSNPQKYFINGYTGYIPYRHRHFGKAHLEMSIGGLRDFSNEYMYRKRTEWAPVVIPKKKRDYSHDKAILKHSIYQKDTALMPTYAGHVPGLQYKIGKTFGCAAKKANHYLEEHLFSLELNKCEMPRKKD